MNKDELRDDINRILFHTLRMERVDKIVEFLAPELEKANKWNKVVEIAEHAFTIECEGCPVVCNITGDHLCDYAVKVVNALEGDK